MTPSVRIEHSGTMVWIDDGKHDATVNVTIKAQPPLPDDPSAG
jgi:hypothetical protein